MNLDQVIVEIVDCLVNVDDITIESDGQMRFQALYYIMDLLS